MPANPATTKRSANADFDDIDVIRKRRRSVRYTIDGRHRSKSFRTRIEDDRYRGSLLRAVQDNSRFDEATGRTTGLALHRAAPGFEGGVDVQLERGSPSTA